MADKRPRGAKRPLLTDCSHPREMKARLGVWERRSPGAACGTLGCAAAFGPTGCTTREPDRSAPSRGQKPADQLRATDRAFRGHPSALRTRQARISAVMCGGKRVESWVLDVKGMGKEEARSLLLLCDPSDRSAAE
jgi:hypothetical protein